MSTPRHDIPGLFIPLNDFCIHPNLTPSRNPLPLGRIRRHRGPLARTERPAIGVAAVSVGGTGAGEGHGTDFVVRVAGEVEIDRGGLFDPFALVVIGGVCSCGGGDGVIGRDGDSGRRVVVVVIAAFLGRRGGTRTPAPSVAVTTLIVLRERGEGPFPTTGPVRTVVVVVTTPMTMPRVGVGVGIVGRVGIVSTSGGLVPATAAAMVTTVL